MFPNAMELINNSTKQIFLKINFLSNNFFLFLIFSRISQQNLCVKKVYERISVIKANFKLIRDVEDIWLLSFQETRN